MKKKNIIYLFVALFLATCIWYLISLNSGNNDYDISQYGSSKSTGHFIPEQKTDYIFTTAEMKTNVSGFIVLGLLISVIIIVLIRKRLKKDKL